MKYIIAIAALSLVLSSCTTQQKPEPKRMPEITVATGAADPVLRVKNHNNGFTQHGTGTLIQHNGKLIVFTALHVIEGDIGTGVIELQTADRRRIEFMMDRIIRFPQQDIAALCVSNLSADITPMQTTDYRLGSGCRVLGFPNNDNLSSGSCSTVNARIYFCGRMVSGMSGGPLLTDGKFSAVAISRTEDCNGGFAIPINKLLELIN